MTLNGPNFQRAQNITRVIQIIGALLLAVCIALLMITWVDDGNWLWVVFGGVVIVANTAFIGYQVYTWRQQSRSRS